MGAATVVRLPDRDACRRLSELVAQLDGVARTLAAGEEVIEWLTDLQIRAASLAEDVQARMPWVVRNTRPALTGKLRGRSGSWKEWSDTHNTRHMEGVR